jgi:hypothetical protein
MVPLDRKKAERHPGIRRESIVYLTDMISRTTSPTTAASGSKTACQSPFSAFGLLADQCL